MRGKRETRSEASADAGVADKDRRRSARVRAVLLKAEESGLRADKAGRIAGRISSELIKKARARTGLTSDTELIEFALANVALEDNFAETFRRSRGTVDPALKLGF